MMWITIYENNKAERGKFGARLIDVILMLLF